MESKSNRQAATVHGESSAERSRTRLRRFGVHEIVFHWTVAIPYLALGASGLVLLIENTVGRDWISRQLLVTVHQIAGLALIALPTLVLAFSPPKPFIENLRTCLHWSLSDLWWLHVSALRVFFPQMRLPRAGKFNAGQKLNLLHITFLLPIVAVTGVVLWIAGSSQLVVRAMHVGVAGLSLFLAAGHIYMALVLPSTRKALGGMFHGLVDGEHAARHHPTWFEAVTGEVASADSRASPRVRKSVVMPLAFILVLTVLTGAMFTNPQWSLEGLFRRYMVEPARLVSPGALHELHSAESQLASCTACHEPFGTVATERCLGCHKEIEARLEIGAGYHGTLGRDCGTCHRDHRPQIVDLDDAAFQHDLATFVLEGAHRRLECRSCHDRDGDGRRTYLSIAHGACGDCHEDPHEPTFEKTCSHCHRETAWNEPAESFSHDRDTSFALSGAHERAPCSSCHGITDGDRVAMLSATPGACRDCHRDPHGAEVPGRNGGPGGDCSRCHESTQTWSAGNFDHDTHTRVPLDARHRELPCSTCHSATDRLRYRELAARLRTASPSFTCEGCHRDIDNALRGDLGHEPTELTTASPHLGEVSCTECHELSPGPVTRQCNACHPPDYDELFVDWQSRVSKAVIRSSEFARRQFWRLRGIHNWQGTVKALRARSTGNQDMK